jgi:hypothetical protein
MAKNPFKPIIPLLHYSIIPIGTKFLSSSIYFIPDSYILFASSKII